MNLSCRQLIGYGTTAAVAACGLPGRAAEDQRDLALKLERAATEPLLQIRTLSIPPKSMQPYQHLRVVAFGWRSSHPTQDPTSHVEIPSDLILDASVVGFMPRSSAAPCLP